MHRRALILVLTTVMVALPVSSEPPSVIDQVWELNSQGRFIEAINLAKSQLTGDVARDHPLMLAMAFAYRYVDSLEAAEAIYLRLLELNPNDIDARLGLALILSWQDRLEESIHHYQQALRVDPVNIDALIGLARVLGWRGAYQEALHYLGIAMQQNIAKPEVYKTIGDIYMYAGELDAAFNAYQIAVKLAPNRANYYVQAGKVAEWLGNYRVAQQLYLRALEIDPHNSQAYVGLHRVRRQTALNISMKVNNFEEYDQGYRGTYKNGRIVLRKALSKILSGEIWMEFSSNKRLFTLRGDTSSSVLTIIYPKLIFTPHRQLRLDLGVGYDFANNYVAGFIIAGSYWTNYFTTRVSWAREILEPTKYILIEGPKFNISIKPTNRIELKAGYGQSNIYHKDTTNFRKQWETSLNLQLLRNPLKLSLSYGYSFLSYKEWSPHYFSPDTFQTHNIGVMLYKAFNNLYFYTEYFRAFGPNGLQTNSGSLEIGYGGFYLSISYFQTSLDYRNWRLTTGYTFRWY